MTEPTARTAAPPAGPQRPSWGPVVFVWGVWAAALVGAVGFMLTYGTRWTPCLDEWHHLDAPLTPGWLWAQHQEHRLPLAKLIWLVVLRLTDYNFFVGNVLQVGALAGMAAAMIVTAGQLRGGTAYYDALFPLAYLNPG